MYSVCEKIVQFSICLFKKLPLKISKEDVIWRLRANKIIGLYFGGRILQKKKKKRKMPFLYTKYSIAGHTHSKRHMDTWNPRSTDGPSDSPFLLKCSPGNMAVNGTAGRIALYSHGVAFPSFLFLC